jgi:hypothetical protein
MRLGTLLLIKNLLLQAARDKISHVKSAKTLNSNEWVGLVLGSGLLFGTILRIVPVILAGFPIYDGGMFMRMIEDLATSQYVLPLTTSYNLLDIPYAYPPLGFYIARVLSDIFRIPELALLRWLPVIFNILSIFAFHVLALAILKDRIHAALATAFLAVTPGGYLWQIMGGGLTRALGGLFLLLSAYALLSLFKLGGWKQILFATLACSLAVLSHPEIALHTLGTCSLCWLFYGRTKRGTVHAFFVVFGTTLVTSIWWLTVMLRFGLDPFFSVLHTGLYGTPVLLSLKSIVLSRISVIPVFPVLRLAGIAWCLWKRKFFLVAWVILPIIVEPRSSAVIALYPLSMLAAIGFVEALPFLINRVRERNEYPLLANVTQSRVLNLAIMSVILYLFLDHPPAWDWSPGTGPPAWLRSG